MEARNEITSDTIKKSFKTYVLNFLTNGLEDDMIHSFKNDQPYKSRKEILASQLSSLIEKVVNPFIDVDDGIDMAAPDFMSIDSNQEDNEDIENLWNNGRRKLRRKLLNIERYIMPSIFFLYICEDFCQNFYKRPAKF